MENKRFVNDGTIIVDTEVPNGKTIETKTVGDAELLVTFLNRLHEDREKFFEKCQVLCSKQIHFKFVLDESIKNERTEIGKSVLKQFKEAVE